MTESQTIKKNYLEKFSLAKIRRETNAETEPSYAAGLCDATEGPSGDMDISLPHQEPSSSQELNIVQNCFVVKPFQPPSGWFVARVTDIDPVKRKVQCEWLYTTNGKEYSYKEPGDIGYRQFQSTWEYTNSLLCIIPEMDTIWTSSRMKLIMPSDVYDTLNDKYVKWANQ